jgi:putative transposase
VYGTSGHVWQGRFKSFPVQDDEHLLTVLRYTLLNPVRAKLVRSSRDWPWTSLAFPFLVDPWPLSPPQDLASWLRDTNERLEGLRECLVRRRPYGSPAWQQALAAECGFGATVRP